MHIRVHVKVVLEQQLSHVHMVAALTLHDMTHILYIYMLYIYLYVESVRAATVTCTYVLEQELSHESCHVVLEHQLR